MMKYQLIVQDFIVSSEINERDIWLQQDSAVSAYTAGWTLNMLQKFFEDRVIGKGLQPPQSSDLTANDFFVG